MLVDVVQMRIRGERRSKEDVRAAAPLRGVLQLDFARPGWHHGQKDAPLLAGLVVPGRTEWALPPLDNARVRSIRGINIYIVGIEEIARDRRRIEPYPQAWWCRLVLDAGTIAAAGYRTSAQHSMSVASPLLEHVASA